eukprot:CAMPEP_0115130978 /NCGR_PEP_ID=MMETSP0227-20121206/52811_1 /TAXON_ID=89957 /ORGANISM="Polarella glacialis, Strain CCMP 1383" /LENGTH=40 /DNA_ID= /DNA_START= /DNA_END= /DNA_ORIENTATION=
MTKVSPALMEASGIISAQSAFQSIASPTGSTSSIGIPADH